MKIISLIIIVMLSVSIGYRICANKIQKPKECGYEQHKERLEAINGSKLSLYVKG